METNDRSRLDASVRRAVRSLVFSPGVALAIAAFLVHLVPELAPWLQYERAAVRGGEVWRLVTCHLVHWSWDHLLWDAGTLALLALVLDRGERARHAIALVLATLAIPLIVGFLQPELQSYRGLSGLASVSFAMLVALEIGDGLLSGERRRTAVLAVLAVAFAAKLAFETVSGQTFFTASGAADFVPVPLAHLVGAFIGLALTAWSGWGPLPSPGASTNRGLDRLSSVVHLPAANED